MVPGQGPEDWGLFDGQDGSSPHSAFNILSRGPVPPTQASRHRSSRKRGDRQAAVDRATRELLLRAYPPLYSKESEETRLARARWCEETWKRIKGAIQESMDSADHAVFASIARFAGLHRREGCKTPTKHSKGYRIPTALVLAGSIASSEQSDTFPKMLDHLRAAGHPVALLRDVHFSSSRPEAQLSNAFNTILRQLSKELEESEASDLEALTAWYEDFAATSDQQQSSHRPIIIIESIEAAPLSTLQDMVSIFYENWSHFPLVLVLGTRTSAATPTAILPADLITRALDCHHFSLSTAVARLEGIVKHALLGTSPEFPGIMFHHRIISTLWDSFLMHHFSPGIIIHGLRLAVIAHSKTTRLELCKDPVQRDVRHTWLRWSAALRCAVESARAAGVDPSYGLNYWQLYRDALKPSYSTSRQAQNAMSHLNTAIMMMDTDGTMRLIDSLKEILAGCTNTANGRRADTTLLQAIETLESIAHGNETTAVSTEGDDTETQGDGNTGSETLPRVKRTKCYSKSSRRLVMMGNARRGEDSRGRPTSSSTQSMSSRLATWLSSWLLTLLGSPPTSHAQASGVTCKDVTALDCLTAAPREAIHLALSRPTLFYPSLSTSKPHKTPAASAGVDSQTSSLGIKIAPGVEDACIAYRLFDENASCSNVAEWYCAFKDVCLNVSGSKNPKQAPAIPEDHLVARFCQATAELQYMGLLKPATKGGKEVVLRAVHMPAPVLSLTS